MAEPRRVPLLPAKASVANEKLSSSKIKEDNDNGDAIENNTASSKIQKSVRLEVSLSTSNEKHCPEYSYLELIKEKVGSGHSTKQQQKTGLDPFDDDDDDQLKALAKKFEDKYGPKEGAVKKGKKRKYDSNPYYHDIGYGYDESDPFVDNTEAYDELVPADWTTQYGGFYINQGELHYRPMMDGDVKEFKTPKKKRVLDGKKVKAKAGEKSTSKTPKELSTQKRKKQLLSKEKKQKKLESALASQKVKKRKIKQIIDDDSIGYQKKSPAKSETKLLSPKEISFSSPKSTSNGKILNLSGNSKYSESPGKAFTSPENEGELQMFNKYQYDKSALNNGTSYDKSQTGKDFNINSGNTEVSTGFTGPSSTAASQQQNVEAAKETRKETEVPSSPPSLPENLPLILEAGIQNLKDAAANCQNGKCRFFDVSVNKTLLGVARNLTKLPCKVRTTAYDYLAFYLPCSKETLVKRAKTLMIEDQVNQLDGPMTRLKEAIEREMPHQKKLYDAEVANALTERVREQMKQSGFSANNDDDSSFDKSMVSADEKDSSVISETTAVSNEDKVKKNMPKRKFSWNEELRKLLCDLVTVKVQVYKMSKSRSMTAEEYIKDFLENDVRKLWPKGWMTSRILFKESKSAHQEVTQPTSKAKKEKTVKKSDPTPIQRLHGNSNLEQPKLKSCSSSTNLVEARSDTMDSADLKVKVSSKQETKSKSVTTNSSVSNAPLKKASEKVAELIQKPLVKSDTVAKEIVVKTDSKSTVLRPDPQTSSPIKDLIYSKSQQSSSSKFDTNTNNVMITNPFEKSSYTRSSAVGSGTITFSKANRQGLTAVMKTDLPAGKQTKQVYEKSVHSILDYASASGDSIGLKVPSLSSAMHTTSKAAVTEASRAKQPLKSQAASKVVPTLSQPSSQVHSKWTSHAHSAAEHPSMFFSQIPKYQLPMQHIFHDVPPQSAISSKHTSQASVPKPVYKTPPKEHHKSLSVTPPKSSAQSVSPRAVASGTAVSRTSPLLHYPSKIDQQRRLSGHSTEDLRSSHAGLSHSISRLTRDPVPQPGIYTSVTIPKMQAGPAGHEQIPKLSQQQQQPLGTPSPMDILLQQTQLHMKQQALKQLQHQKHQQQQQQQQQSMQQQQHAQQMQPGQGLDLNPESFNIFAPLPFQGSTGQEQYPGPYSNYRPQFI